MTDPSSTYDVFLSHNVSDKPRVRRLAERLRDAGLSVWFDEWVIGPGDDIYLAIERGLEAARVQILCLSPAALGSDWVALERNTVLFRDPANKYRRFVPLLLADCRLPDTLRRYKYVDFRKESDAAFEELLVACSFVPETWKPARKIKDEEILNDLRRRVLTARSPGELSKILYELEEYLAKHPHSPEPRMLKDSIEEAMQREESRPSEIRYRRRASPMLAIHPSWVGAVSAVIIAVTAAISLIWGSFPEEPTLSPPSAVIQPTAKLIVHSNVSDAIVYINGKPVGTVGSMSREIVAGKYKIRVEKKGYKPHETEITLAPGENKSLPVTLEPTGGTITTPIDGAIFIPIHGGVEFEARGTITLQPNQTAWLAVRIGELYWPKASAIMSSGSWIRRVWEGGSEGRKSLVLLVVDEVTDKAINDWFESSREKGDWPGMPLGEMVTVVDEIGFTLGEFPARKLGTSEPVEPDYANWRILRKIKAHPGGEEGGICCGHGLEFAPDGRTILSGSGDKTLKLWDVASGQKIRTFRGHSSYISSLAFASDGSTILSGGGYGDNTIKLWDVNSGQEIRTFQGHSDWVNSVDFASDGRTVLSGSQDGTLRLWDVASGQTIRTLMGHTSGIYSVAFASDGRTALSGSSDKTIKLWDVVTGREIRTFRGHSHFVESVVFSPDGRTVLSGSYDKTLKLWDIASGREIHTFLGHSESVDSIAFAPDGRTVLSGSSDNTLKLWNVASGEKIRTLKGHSDDVRSVAFSPDGQRAASGDYAGDIILWGAE